MARVGVDGTHVSPDGKGHALSQRKAVEGLAARGHDVVAFLRDPAGAALLGGHETYVVRSPKTIVWELWELPRAARALRLDAVLTLSDRLPLHGRGVYVVWLFESPAHRIAANVHARAGLYQRATDAITGALWKRSLRRAEVVVAGSQATAGELEEAVPQLRGRVSVVYPALRDGFSPAPRGDGPRYVFHLSSSDPRDNTETVLAALALVPETLLVLGGGLGGRQPFVESEVERLGLAGRVRLTGRLPEEELIELYRGAAAYVDATLYEGFGYQVLEAMACGTPVVASSATSIPEVLGGAGLTADPRSPAAIAEQLARVLADADLAADLRRRGLARAAEFSWERTADGLAAAVEEALA